MFEITQSFGPPLPSGPFAPVILQAALGSDQRELEHSLHPQVPKWGVGDCEGTKVQGDLQVWFGFTTAESEHSHVWQDIWMGFSLFKVVLIQLFQV